MWRNGHVVIMHKLTSSSFTLEQGELNCQPEPLYIENLAEMVACYTAYPNMRPSCYRQK